ncbi:MAG TPA: hypothetical protein PKI14_01405 [Fervidobacterium sp.]|nr:hypothetical protein [Fervidobacterium sp.]
MKRSEMVRLIETYFAERYGNGPLSYLDDGEFSDFLLTKIEEQGMLPPLTKLNQLGMMDNGWDAEDGLSDEEFISLISKSQANFGVPEYMHITDPDTGEFVFFDVQNPSDEAIEVLKKVGLKWR